MYLGVFCLELKCEDERVFRGLGVKEGFCVYLESEQLG